MDGPSGFLRGRNANEIDEVGRGFPLTLEGLAMYFKGVKNEGAVNSSPRRPIRRMSRRVRRRRRRGRGGAFRRGARGNMERTLILLKPDCVQRRLVGTILARFEQK